MSKADALRDAGNRHFKKEDFCNAIKCYREGLLLDPGNPTLNCNLAQAYLAINNFADAEVHAVVTLAHQADSVKGFYRATKAALGMDKKERALSYLRKGLARCPRAEELRILYEEITKESEGAVSSNAGLNAETEKNETDKNKIQVQSVTENGTINLEEKVRASRNDQQKQRSRSSNSRKRNNSGGSKNIVSARSVSGNRTTNLPLNVLRQSTSSELQQDEFLNTLEKVRSGLSADEKSPQLKERETLMEKQKKLQIYMKEGSKALETGLSKQASEKYKCALDIMVECNIEIFGLSEIDLIVLKYSLSICWIETLNYSNLVQSVGYLMEIEKKSADKLPAVYYGLGYAFYRLNRFKVALNHLDSGAKVITNCADIVPHPWPGTMKIITETTKTGLTESISILQYKCRIYHEPDAICRFKDCLTVNVNHICPSEIIYCSDPDFVGYVVVICQERCRITYHVGCWKHYKESLASVGKLTDKDALGKSCPTNDCMNKRNEVSVIVRIEVYGEDGKIKTSCCKEPSKTDNINEHRKEKKKKNEKTEKPVKVKTVRKIKKIRPIVQSNTKTIKKKPGISSEDFAECMQKLAHMRKINFGFQEPNNWNPQKDYFGRNDISVLKTYLNSTSNDSKILRERKDFIFTYFYEFLNDEGPQKVSALEKKWHEEVSQFPGINDFMSQHDGICDFLLKSYRFACIDDYLCLAEQISETYKRVLEEVGESISFILNDSIAPLEGNSNNTTLKAKRFNENSYLRNSLIRECLLPLAASTSNTFSKVFPVNTMVISESSSEEIDFDECFDYDYDYDNENDNESNDNFSIDNSETVKNAADRNLPVEISTNEPVINVSHESSFDPPDHFEEDNLEHVDLKTPKSQISDTSVQCVGAGNNHNREMQNAMVQTDDTCVLEEEIQSLRDSNNLLTQEKELWNKEKQELILSYQKQLEECQQKIKEHESKTSSLVAEKETMKNSFQHDINVRDAKLEATKQKFQEEIQKLMKKRDEDSKILKKNLESMNELNKEIETQANAIKRLEGQLRKSNEQILSIRKALVECKLDSYIAKCQERLQGMNVVTDYFESSMPPNGEIKTAIEAWEEVTRVLRETRDLLQVQYEILSQQLKSKMSSDFLLELKLADLPSEPYYPLQDMNTIIHLAMQHVQQKNVSEHKKSENKNIGHYNYVNNGTSSNSSPLSGASMFYSQGKATSVNGSLPNQTYTQPYPNMFNPFLNPIPTIQTDHHFNSFNTSENMKRGITCTEIQAKPPRSKSVESGKLSPIVAGLEDFKKILETFEVKIQNIENLANTEEGQSTVDMKTQNSLGDKGNSSSASGLAPIQTKGSGLTNVTGSISPSFNSVVSNVDQNIKAVKHWNYEKLLNELQKFFRMTSEAELSECLSMIREKNGNKLSGLPVLTILRKVEKLLEERSSKKVGNLGMDKFGGTAWGEVKDGDVNWQNDDLDKECVICHINIENNKTDLQCKHAFHTECIRKWLHTNSTCPICRKYTRLDDEFPPLS